MAKKGKALSGYVVYMCEQLRDGSEEGAKCFGLLEDALEFINKDRFARSNYQFRLFKLGDEIDLETFTEEKPQPAVVTQMYRVKN